MNPPMRLIVHWLSILVALWILLHEGERPLCMRLFMAHTSPSLSRAFTAHWDVKSTPESVTALQPLTQIGRASCRERV